MTRHPVPRSLLVIGAQGFIGSAVVAAALAAGTRVTAACTSPPWRWSPGSLPDVRTELLPQPWWESEDHLARLAEGCQAAVLLSYTAPHGADAVEHEREVNVSGTFRAARAAAAAGARVVLAGTAEVYGSTSHPVDELTPLAPATPYARGKAAAEKAVADVAGPAGACVLRLGTTYGPGELHHRAVPRFVTALLRGERPEVRGDGLDVHDFVSVHDVATALLRAAAAPSGWSVLNVGTGHGRTTLDILSAVAHAVGVTALPRHLPADRPRRRIILDPSQLHRQLGVRPSADLMTHVHEEVAWLREHVTAQQPNAAGRATSAAAPGAAADASTPSEAVS